ncbi:hypothetical protein BDZ97DRAFT_1919976 [Flammula alnicola]|nr:hypothetical protein BDZ97DRAFT_1919976 [Flammula alnicola]
MATITTTTIQQGTPLRKRMRVLERAHSLTSLNTLASTDVKTLPLADMKLKHKDSGKDMPPSPIMDYESPSESSDEEHEHSSGAEEHPSAVEHPKLRRPTIDTAEAYRYKAPEDRSSMSPNARAWYEFDLAVVVALVSPIGNWLTGTDHIKNLFLIFLLIFYLHQIIEIPWSLYQKSRPRNRATQLPPSAALANTNSPESRYSQLAASELQKLEFFFLFLTFISPFLGAALLRFATDAILGPDAVSWFSTGLFVLATGMRPWAHLIDRLSQRTTDLHDFVHYPPPAQPVALEEYQALENRVAQLEKALSKIKTKVANTTEDVYEYVDDAVDAVEHAMRKQERKYDKYEGKVKEVEQVVVQLSASTTPRHGTVTQEDSIRGALAADIRTLKAYLSSILEHTIPAWIMLPSRRMLYGTIYTSGPSTNSSSTIYIGNQLSSGKIPMRSLSGQSSPSQPSTPLETILEEEPVYVPAKSSNLWLLAQPYYLTSSLVYRIGYLATTPLRAVARMVLRNY